VTQIFQNDQPSHGGGRKIFEVMAATLPKGTLGSVASLLAATHSGERPILIALSVRSKHIRVRFITL
jgi:hypothetical protein